MKFKGTEGKWTVDSDNNIYSNKELIACVYGYVVKGVYRYKKKAIADAKLISKAPEMLMLLEYFVENNMLSIAGEEMAQQLIKESTTI